MKLFLLLLTLTTPLLALTKVTFIVNPFSGVGKNKKIEQLIAKNLDHSLFTYEVLYTEYPKHATKLSAEAVKRGVEIIVSVGGDGTANEVAQGMIGGAAALAILPTGSGNGFARHFEIPVDIAKAIQVMNRRKEQWIDTIQVNGKTCLGVAGVGFDADVSATFSNYQIRGPASYLLAVFLELPLYKTQEYQLMIDGELYTRRAFLICFANTMQYGNNAFIAPHAKIDDGYLDVIVWKEFPPHAAPKLIHDLFTKHLCDSKYTELFRCQEVILKKNPKTLHLDGEPYPVVDDVYIRVLPSSLRILIP